MADETVIKAFRRFVTEVTELESIYKTAFAAYQERSLEVVITSASFEGGGGNGTLAGKPQEIMEVCELLLDEKELLDAGDYPESGPTHISHARRIIGT